MVEVALHQRLRTVNVSLLPSSVVTHFFVGIAIAVGFLIGLVHHVEAPAVAQLVEVFAVGIVAGAQEVDVRLLHQCDILFVGGIVDIAARHGMVIVTIHTTQLHVLAVNLKHLTRAFHTLHAQMVVEVFEDLFNRSGFQLNAERIEIRFLSRPQAWLVNGAGNDYMRCIACRQTFHEPLTHHTFYFQDGFDVLDSFLAHIADGDVGSNCSFSKVLVRHSRHMIVGNMYQRAHPQLHAAEDTAQAPHILILQITAVAPAIHLDGQLIAALTDEFRHVELSWRHRVLAVTHLLSVHPHIEGGMHAAEM